MIVKAISLIILSALTVLACLWSPSITADESSGIELKLPAQIGILQGIAGKPDKEELRLLPSDTQYAKMTYQTPTQDINERDEVHFSIVLAGSERRSIHRPEICLPGQGWTITDSKVVSCNITANKDLKLRDLSIEKEVQDPSGSKKTIRAHYYYWFIGKNMSTASHFERIWHSTWDSIFKGINHRWAYASVLIYSTENTDPRLLRQRQRTEEQSSRLLEYILKVAVPCFQKSFMSEA